MPRWRGWILGHLIDGTQAEYVRVPHADLSTHPLPGAVDSKDAVLLADIFPTAYEVGVLNGRVRPADTLVVVGAGPIGLAAIATARLYTPGKIIAVDLAPARLDAAKRLGADAVAAAGRRRSSWSPTSPRAWGPMWSSRRWGCPRASRRVCAWCGPAGTWPTSACTASP